MQMKNSSFTSKTITGGLTAIALIVCSVISSPARAQQSEPPLVTVAGEHVIKVAPDEAELNFTVSTKLKDAPETQQANDKIVAKVLAYLAGEGIPKSDIRTTRVNLRPHIEYISDKERKELYLAQQSITVRLKDLEKLPTILSGLVDLGVNNIDDVEFKASNLKSLQAKARAEAVLDAKVKAETLAGALGQEVGNAYQIMDQTSENNPPRPVMYRMEAQASDSSASIAPGEIEVRAQVLVKFHLR